MITSIVTFLIFPALATIIAGVFIWMYISKPKLYLYCNNVGYATLFPPKDAKYLEKIGHFTHSITIVNGGNMSLKNIQIFHNLDISRDRTQGIGNKNLIELGIFPDIPCKFDDDGKILIFDSLAPKEKITIHYIYSPDITYNTLHQFISPNIPLVRSDQALGQQIDFIKRINIPKGLNILIGAFIIIGFWVSISFLVNFILG